MKGASSHARRSSKTIKDDSKLSEDDPKLLKVVPSKPIIFCMFLFVSKFYILITTNTITITITNTITIIIIIIRIGGWGSGTVVRQHPNREIDFNCACLACVRAKLRARDDSAVARVGQIKLSVVQPSGFRGPGTLSLPLAWVFVRMFN